VGVDKCPVTRIGGRLVPRADQRGSWGRRKDRENVRARI
jgi:hypothetical protein